MTAADLRPPFPVRLPPLVPPPRIVEESPTDGGGDGGEGIATAVRLLAVQRSVARSARWHAPLPPPVADALRHGVAAMLSDCTTAPCYLERQRVRTAPSPRTAAVLHADGKWHCKDGASPLCRLFTAANATALSHGGATVGAIWNLINTAATRELGRGVYGVALELCPRQMPPPPSSSSSVAPSTRSASSGGGGGSSGGDCAVMKIVGASFDAPRNRTTAARVYNEIAKYAAVHRATVEARTTPHTTAFYGYAMETAAAGRGAEPYAAVCALFMERVRPWRVARVPISTFDTLSLHAITCRDPAFVAHWRLALPDAPMARAWWRWVFAQMLWTALALQTGLGRGLHNDLHTGNVLLTPWPSAHRPTYALHDRDGRVRFARVPSMLLLPCVKLIDYGMAQGDVLDSAPEPRCDVFDVFRIVRDVVDCNLRAAVVDTDFDTVDPVLATFLLEGLAVASRVLFGTYDARATAPLATLLFAATQWNVLGYTGVKAFVHTLSRHGVIVRSVVKALERCDVLEPQGAAMIPPDAYTIAL